MKRYLVCLTLLLVSISLAAQQRIVLDTKAASSLLEWFSSDCPRSEIERLVTIPANQLMEQSLLHAEDDAKPFSVALEEFSQNGSTLNNLYLLNDAYSKRLEIAELVGKLSIANYSESIYSNVIKYFPLGYTPPRCYDVYFDATGWKWGDAQCFSYTKEGDKYTISDSGTPVIVFNLTLVTSTYGKTIEAQLSTLTKVMSHELFHAILSDYSNQHWNFDSNANRSSKLKYLLMNEGIAHYLADANMLNEKYVSDSLLRQQEKRSFDTLSEKMKVIADPTKAYEEVQNVFNKGLSGPYYEKYICITGMFMAYHIEQQYGIDEIRKCIEHGPQYFIERYNSTKIKEPQLPSLSETLLTN